MPKNTSRKQRNVQKPAQAQKKQRLAHIKKMEPILRSLLRYVLKNDYEELRFTYFDGLIPILFNTIGSSNINDRLVLMIISRLLILEDVSVVFIKEPDFIKKLIQVFIESSDHFIKEFSSMILCELFKRKEIEYLVLDKKLFLSIFKILNSETDLDIIKNSLNILLNIIRCENIKQFINQMDKNFNIKIIYNFLGHNNYEISQFSFEILYRLPSIASLNLKRTLKDNFIVLELFKYLQVSCWEDKQNKALGAILNCIESRILSPFDLNYGVIYEFLKDTPINKYPKSFARLAIIRKLIGYNGGLKMMVTADIIHYFSVYLEVECDLTNYIACNAILEYIERTNDRNCFMTKFVIGSLARIIKAKELCWSPYREAPVHLIYLFVQTSEYCYKWIYECGILSSYEDCLKNMDNISPKVSEKIIITYFRLSNAIKIKKRLSKEQEFIKIIQNLLENKQDCIKEHALSLLSSMVQYKEYQQWFSKEDGLDKYMSLYFIGNDSLKLNILKQLDILFKYYKIADNFIVKGYLSVLTSIPLKNRYYSNAQLLINKLCSHNPSLKFHLKNKLEEFDIIKSGFHLLYAGYNQDRSFPMRHEIKKENNDCSNTILLVSFGEHLKKPLKSEEKIVREIYKRGDSLEEVKSKDLQKSLYNRVKIAKNKTWNGASKAQLIEGRNKRVHDRTSDEHNHDDTENYENKNEPKRKNEDENENGHKKKENPKVELVTLNMGIKKSEISIKVIKSSRKQLQTELCKMQEMIQKNSSQIIGKTSIHENQLHFEIPDECNIIESGQSIDKKQNNKESNVFVVKTNVGKFKFPVCNSLDSLILTIKKLVLKTKNIRERVKIIAKCVDVQLSGKMIKGVPVNKDYEVYMCYLKNALKSNVIPIGLMQAGRHLERAVLFKTLCDRIKVPCILRRRDHNIAWNEVPIPDLEINPPYMTIVLNVVDLMRDIGKMYPVGSYQADNYCTT